MRFRILNKDPFYDYRFLSWILMDDLKDDNKN